MIRHCGFYDNISQKINQKEKGQLFSLVLPRGAEKLIDA
jgi:hypothetical protein